jgi:4-oxalocrotonate tautomerase
MPIVEVHLFEGRNGEQKRKLVSEMTRVICEVLDVKPEVVRIILDEMSKENFAIAGTLVSEKKS